MKQSLSKTFLAALTLASAASLISCGGNDKKDEPVVPAPTYSEIVVTYSLSLSEAYYDFWDIQVTYTGMGGITHTEEVTLDWEMSYHYSPDDEIAQEFVFDVKGLPKAEVPEVDPDEVYALSKTVKFVAYGKRTDGRPDEIIGGSANAVTSNMNIRGSHLLTKLTEGINITEGTYTVQL